MEWGRQRGRREGEGEEDRGSQKKNGSKNNAGEAVVSGNVPRYSPSIKIYVTISRLSIISIVSPFVHFFLLNQFFRMI